MNVMHGPEKAYSMGDSMVDVPRQVVENEREGPTPDSKVEFIEAEVNKDHRHDCQWNEVADDHIQAELHQGNENVGRCIEPIPLSMR